MQLFLTDEDFRLLLRRFEANSMEDLRSKLRLESTILLKGQCIWKINIQCPIMLVYGDLKEFKNRKELRDYCKICELRKGISYSQTTTTEQAAKSWVGSHFNQTFEEKKSEPQKDEPPEQSCESCGLTEAKYRCENSGIWLCALCSNEHRELGHTVVEA